MMESVEEKKAESVAFPLHALGAVEGGRQPTVGLPLHGVLSSGILSRGGSSDLPLDAHGPQDTRSRRLSDISLASRSSRHHPVPFNPLRLKRFESTKSHRDTQRAVAATELLNTAVIAPVATYATIPVKVSQVILSSQAFFRPHITTLERTAHGLQASIALIQSIVLGMMFFNGKQCVYGDQNQNTLCQTYVFISLLYNATLLVGWVPAEFCKEQHASGNAEPQEGVSTTPVNEL